ncbi:MAG: FCD domain-containing protein, partial [Candidatus Dormibacteria bacterium]
VIDGLVARLSAERGLSRAERRRSERALEAMERANEGDDKKAYMVANTDFHMGLLNGLNHRWLDQFSTLVRMSCQATYLRRQHQTDRLRHSADEHRGILRAILDRDQVLAETLARSHILNARNYWVGLERDFPPGGHG